MNVALRPRCAWMNPATDPSHTRDDRLVFLDAATFVRSAGEPALRDLTWSMRAGETWAVVGPVGSGKTALAEALLGQHRLVAGQISWPLLDALRAAGRPVGWPSDVVRHVSFKEESRLFSYSRHYYQQRFNFIEPADDLTLGDFLRDGSGAVPETIQDAADRLGVGGLLPLSFIKLSNGQVRRARIARALLARPELLILDEPFMGLDPAGRDHVAALLGSLVRQGLRILLITRPDAIPEWVTHVLTMDALTAHWQGLRPADRGIEIPSQPAKHSRGVSSGPPLPVVVELRGVDVCYGGRTILGGVDWTVRAGERWAVLGPNGSGKSTLLSLICGDHPQAYSNDVRLFGRRRGTGESIWDVKRTIGLVSPELHLYFTEPLTAAQTAATGFHDVLTHRPTTPQQDQAIRDLFEAFGIVPLLDRSFGRLSTGEQRLVLFVRALVKQPPLVILDEPFQGLDEQAVRRARNWLNENVRSDQTLIFVTHHAGEIPQTVNRYLRLEAGRIVEVV